MDSPIKNLRKRFVSNELDRDEAVTFKVHIKKWYGSFYMTGYDESQLPINGIPYYVA